jgi:hypothetical protein
MDTRLRNAKVEALVRASSFFFFAVVFSACTADLGRVVDVPEIPVARLTEERGVPHVVDQVAVSDFRDLRAGLEDRSSTKGPIQPMGAVSSTVKRSVVKALELRGIPVNDGAPIVLQGEIREWGATVESGVLSTVRTQAVLLVEVFDATDKKVYSGTYSGSTSVQVPVVSRSEVESALGSAMYQAILQFVNDPQMLRLLSTL